MRLQYLPANAAHVVTFGDQIIAIDDVRFHETRADAVRRLDYVGLGVKRSGEIFSKEEK